MQEFGRFLEPSGPSTLVSSAWCILKFETPWFRWSCDDDGTKTGSLNFEFASALRRLASNRPKAILILDFSGCGYDTAGGSTLLLRLLIQREIAQEAGDDAETPSPMESLLCLRDLRKVHIVPPSNDVRPSKHDFRTRWEKEIISHARSCAANPPSSLARLVLGLRLSWVMDCLPLSLQAGPRAVILQARSRVGGNS